MFKHTSLILVAAFVFFNGCSSYNDVDYTPTFVGPISDNPSWYGDSSVKVSQMDVFIPTPNTSLCAPYDNQFGPLHPCTLEDVNNDIYRDDLYKPELNVRLSTATFNNPNELTNAVMRMKGDYSRQADQKSYRVKLDSSRVLLNGERTMILNKHQADVTRVKNKLAFDLFKNIPNFVSLKTEFVNLKINGVDKGLFTRVEEVKKEFLVNRGWSKNDRIYKANNFLFHESDDFDIDSDGDIINPEAFDIKLEAETGENHTAFAKMLAAVNTDMSDAAFDIVFNKYFDRANYLTWMAINIIIGNKDTTQHNYSLYNPEYSETFYFIPWDYDGAWATKRYLTKYQYGYGVWWDVLLHRKFLKIAKNRADLHNMIYYLRDKYFSPEIVQKHLDSYDPIVRAYLSKLPDSQYLDLEYWETNLNLFNAKIDNCIAMYEEEIGHPMPFEQDISTDGLIKWTQSVDLEGNQMVYEFKISSNSDMNSSVIYSANNINALQYKVDLNVLKPGAYYLQVISRETGLDGNTSHYQHAYSEVGDEIKSAMGVLEFFVP